MQEAALLNRPVDGVVEPGVTEVQVVQAVAPLADENVPVPQEVQGEFPLVEYFPGVQTAAQVPVVISPYLSVENLETLIICPVTVGRLEFGTLLGVHPGET